MTFWPCRKNGWIRKIRLTTNVMMPQPGQQTITVQILPKSHEVKATRHLNLVN